MSIGECTVTLQNVEVLMALHIDGNPITDQSHDCWLFLCQVLLGMTLSAEKLKVRD